MGHTQPINCRVIFEYKNYQKDDFFDLQGDRIFYYFQEPIISNTDSICLSIQEPIWGSLIINNYIREQDDIKSVWLHEGTINVTIDFKERTVDIKNSELNADYATEQKIYKTIRSFQQPIIEYAQKHYKQLTRCQKDSIETEIENIEDKLADVLYQTHLLKPNSFLALNFLSFHLGSLKRHFTQAQLQYLYNKLGENLKKYPSYKIYGEQIKNYKDSLPSVKPLFPCK